MDPESTTALILTWVGREWILRVQLQGRRTQYWTVGVLALAIFLPNKSQSTIPPFPGISIHNCIFLLRGELSKNLVFPLQIIYNKQFIQKNVEHNGIKTHPLVIIQTKTSKHLICFSLILLDNNYLC